jgi:site-specific DNA recombinase
MALAHLYIRVSTDEQADKGFSQRDQDERLHNYCKLHNITVGQVIYEDYSAKTFMRPEWTRLITHLKKTKASPATTSFLPNGTGLPVKQWTGTT